MRTRLVAAMVIGIVAVGCLRAEAAKGWETDFQKAAKEAKESGKYMLLDFSGSDWCGWCVRLDQEVFSKKEFKAYSKDNLVCVLLDFPRRKPQSKELKRQNRALMKKYGVRGFPTIIVLSPTGQVLARTGYRRGGPGKYVAHLKAIIEPHRTKVKRAEKVQANVKKVAKGSAKVYKKWPFDAKEAKRRQAETAKALGVPVEKTVDLGGGVKLKLVLVPAGEFDMGSRDSAAEVNRKSGKTTDWYKNEHPQHKVRITKPFYMGKFEVTQAQWGRVTGKNPAHFKGAKNPVEQVSWNDCQVFLRKLNARVHEKGSFVLPTEAEWEYACRAGTSTPFHTGETISTDEANYKGNYTYGNGRKGVDRKKAIPVGTLKANAFGLYDMHGNVWEWCEDVYRPYGTTPRPASSSVKRAGPPEHRVLRGGSWYGHPFSCRSSYRSGRYRSARIWGYGFRVVLRDLAGSNVRMNAKEKEPRSK